MTLSRCFGRRSNGVGGENPWENGGKCMENDGTPGKNHGKWKKQHMNDKWENSSKVEKTTHQTLKKNNMTETLRTLKNEQKLINIE